MPAKRNNEKADAMRELYAKGYSLSQVATAFSMSRQGAYKILKLRQVTLRTIEQLPFIVWKDRKFTPDPKGYYRETSGRRRFYLHRLVWESINGPIPDGHDIHHRDHDRQNNRICNLQCLTGSEHMKLHQSEKRMKK